VSIDAFIKLTNVSLVVEDNRSSAQVVSPEPPESSSPVLEGGSLCLHAFSAMHIAECSASTSDNTCPAHDENTCPVQVVEEAGIQSTRIADRNGRVQNIASSTLA
jgi:hypothetical protein